MIPSRQQVLGHLATDGYRPTKLKDLARCLGVGSDDYRAFRLALRQLEQEGEVARVHRGRYVLRSTLRRVWGQLRLHPKGFGFVSRSGADADVFIPAGYLRDGSDGDWVEVEITQAGDGLAQLPRGRIVAVRPAPGRQLVGVFRRRGRFGLVVADKGAAVSLEAPAPAGARDGDLVVVDIDAVGGGLSDRALRGRIERVLGDPRDPRHDFHSVTYAHDVPVEEEPAACAEAAARVERAAADLAAQLTCRRDLRALAALTIDPVEARDFDDAVSLESLPAGRQTLGVHIADVGHFVEPDGAIDRQARERSTSVYLLDRVVHMLPAGLAAGVCTLAPGQDRLAVSVFLDVDGTGRICGRSYCLSVIRSAARLTYDQVQSVLDGTGDGGPAEAHAELLRSMADLSRLMRVRRMDRGAIDFELSEARVEVGDDGIPTALGRRPRLPSHQLVEEFMLAANEAVAELAVAEQLPVLYRIHDPPDPEKLERFRELAAALGQRLPPSGQLQSGHLQLALASFQQRPDISLLSQLLLRAMMRARYAAHPASGHFGLASAHYLHFTSPIRRYPDLVVHRALKAHLASGPAPRGRQEKVDLEWLAAWTSHCERRGEAAERDYVRLKQLRFMAAHVGEELTGVVSGVVGAGLFVEIGEWLVEGFCPVRLMADDDYEFDARSHRILGRRRGTVFTLGTPVRVRVLSVDPAAKRMDLLVVEGGTRSLREGGAGTGRGRKGSGNRSRPSRRARSRRR